MRDAADRQGQPGERRSGACLGETTYPDHERGAQDLDSAPQRRVAGALECCALAGRQIVGCAIAAARLEKEQRAVVRDEEAAEEALGLLEAIACPTPEALARDLAPPAPEAFDGTLRVFAARLRDARPRRERRWGER